MVIVSADLDSNIDASLKIHYLVEQIPQTARSSGLSQARKRRQLPYLYPPDTPRALPYNVPDYNPYYHDYYSPPRRSRYNPPPLDLYKVPIDRRKPRSRSRSGGRSRVRSNFMPPLRRHSTAEEELSSSQKKSRLAQDFLAAVNSEMKTAEMSNELRDESSFQPLEATSKKLLQDGEILMPTRHLHAAASVKTLNPVKEQAQFTESPARLSLEEPEINSSVHNLTPDVFKIDLDASKPAAVKSVKYKKPSVVSLYQ